MSTRVRTTVRKTVRVILILESRTRITVKMAPRAKPMFLPSSYPVNQSEISIV